ncbi:uncharacterized protein ASCRUDRAFT_72851 [Ascoidea rubescens DSM 1968]|uniref:Uncharacterized protein n=1 Tax=Ascoidea rubescens DSM 1968 TaxID=1344418 RepID=A0A1D2V9B1_9ASCO|nr:hypothetical protein ASCRUDRAFT_72851 [Ascoidea rubescens DSM 1968]ODV58218.1 hypothetical protein ASCRUDRAFT_72851 [Ascoidea rubescens DSM 1968]
MSALSSHITSPSNSSSNSRPNSNSHSHINTSTGTNSISANHSFVNIFAISQSQQDDLLYSLNTLTSPVSSRSRSFSLSNNNSTHSIASSNYSSPNTPKKPALALENNLSSFDDSSIKRSGLKQTSLEKVILPGKRYKPLGSLSSIASQNNNPPSMNMNVNMNMNNMTVNLNNMGINMNNVNMNMNMNNPNSYATSPSIRSFSISSNTSQLPKIPPPITRYTGPPLGIILPNQNQSLVPKQNQNQNQNQNPTPNQKLNLSINLNHTHNYNHQNQFVNSPISSARSPIDPHFIPPTYLPNNYNRRQFSNNNLNNINNNINNNPNQNQIAHSNQNSANNIDNNNNKSPPPQQINNEIQELSKQIDKLKQILNDKDQLIKSQEDQYKNNLLEKEKQFKLNLDQKNKNFKENLDNKISDFQNQLKLKDKEIDKLNKEILSNTTKSKLKRMKTQTFSMIEPNRHKNDENKSSQELLEKIALLEKHNKLLKTDLSYKNKEILKKINEINDMKINVNNYKIKLSKNEISLNQYEIDLHTAEADRKSKNFLIQNLENKLSSFININLDDYNNIEKKLSEIFYFIEFFLKYSLKYLPYDFIKSISDLLSAPKIIEIMSKSNSSLVNLANITNITSISNINENNDNDHENDLDTQIERMKKKISMINFDPRLSNIVKKVLSISELSRSNQSSPASSTTSSSSSTSVFTSISSTSTNTISSPYSINFNTKLRSINQKVGDARINHSIDLPNVRGKSYIKENVMKHTSNPYHNLNVNKSKITTTNELVKLSNEDLLKMALNNLKLEFQTHADKSFNKIVSLQKNLEQEKMLLSRLIQSNSILDNKKNNPSNFKDLNDSNNSNSNSNTNNHGKPHKKITNTSPTTTRKGLKVLGIVPTTFVPPLIEVTG